MEIFTKYVPNIFRERATPAAVEAAILRSQQALQVAYWAELGWAGWPGYYVLFLWVKGGSFAICAPHRLAWPHLQRACGKQQSALAGIATVAARRKLHAPTGA